jgi:hypothetical protein
MSARKYHSWHAVAIVELTEWLDDPIDPHPPQEDSP